MDCREAEPVAEPEVVPGPLADPVVTPMRAKGWKRHVRLPEVLRELRAQGRTLDSITVAEVDAAIPSVKYASRSMIEQAWSEIEREEADDGVVNS